MKRFNKGDRVRIDIPDRDDPDFYRLHRQCGTVVDVLDDSAERVTGDERDSFIYRVDLNDTDGTEDVRWRDLRPLHDEK